MSIAGDGTDDEQEIDLDREEILVLCGAMNVSEELLAQPGFESAQYPVTQGQRPVFRRVCDRLQRRLEGVTGSSEPTRIRETLDPQEAQAVRDAAGLLEALLQDPGGREILVEVGFLPRADSAVNREDLETLTSVQQRVDPTGTRPERARPQREESEIIDPTLSVDALVAVAGEEIANAELPWPGWEQAKFMLNNITEEFMGGQTETECDSVFKSMVQVTKLAVAGTRRLRQAPSREIAGQWPVWLDEAYLALMSTVETKHCVGRNAQETLWHRIDTVEERLTPGSTTTDDAAQQLLADLPAVATPPEDHTGGPDPLEQASRAQRDIRIGREDPDDVVAELRHIEDRLDDDLTCDEVFVALIEATDAAIHLDSRAGVNAVQNVSNWLGDVYDSVHNAFVDGRCLTDEDDLDRFDTLARQVAQSVGGDPRGFARTLYNWVEEVLEAGTGLAAVEGREGFDREADDAGSPRLRVEQLRSELTFVLGFEMTEETVRDHINAALPPRTADCATLLVSLAELAQLDAQVVVDTAGDTTQVGAGTVGDRELLDLVQDARRRVMSRMGEEDCLPDSRPVRESFLAIHDPLDDDPEAVEVRAFAALSDIREAIVEHA